MTYYTIVKVPEQNSCCFEFSESAARFNIMECNTE